MAALDVRRRTRGTFLYIIMYRRGAGQSNRQNAQKVRLFFVQHFPENVKISLFSVFLQFSQGKSGDKA